MGIKPSFYPRSQDPSIFNFQIVRSPKNIVGHVVFIQGLFEELNSNRHVFTKLANLLYQQNFESVIFDYYGTGDSQGEYVDVLIENWQQDIIQQLEKLQDKSTKPIILIAFGSAALLLNAEILNLASSAYLWHPEVNGKRFIKQLRRLSLLESGSEAELNIIDNNLEELAGYVCQKKLLRDLAKINFEPSTELITKITWIECVEDIKIDITPSRHKKMILWSLPENQVKVKQNKYWLASELQIPSELISTTLSLIKR